MDLFKVGFDSEGCLVMLVNFRLKGVFLLWHGEVMCGHSEELVMGYCLF